MKLPVHFTSLSAIVLSAFLPCGVAMASSDQVFLNSGGSLQGKIISADSQSLQFRSDAVAQPFSLKNEGVLTAILNNDALPENYPDRVLMQNGDSLPCRILDIGDNSIVMETYGIARLEILQDKVSSILFNTFTPRVLVSEPQSLNAINFTAAPREPEFMSPDLIVKLEEQKAGAFNKTIDYSRSSSRDDTTEKKEITTEDQWTGLAFTRWGWLKKDLDTSLEIPATKGYISKNIGLSDRFVISGTFLGTESPSHVRTKFNDLRNVNELKNGLVMLIGGTYKDHAMFYSADVFNEKKIRADYYALQLTKNEIRLYRISSTDKITLLLSHKFSNSGRQQQSYNFALIGSEDEFQLTIDNKTTIKALDFNPKKITPGRFTIANMRSTSTIIKNLKIASRQQNVSDLVRQLPDVKNQDASCLMTLDGNIIPGNLAGYSNTDGTIKWQIRDQAGAPLSVSKKIVAALILRQAQDNPGPYPRMQYTDSGIITGNIVALNDKNFSISSPLINALNIPRMAIRRIEFPPSPSTLEEKPSDTSTSEITKE